VNAMPLVHVIDDNADVRSSLELLLKSVAIDAQTYATADEFLHELGQAPNRPGVLLLDVRMPGMSGMTLLERLRSEHPSLRVVMMTGHGDIDMAEPGHWRAGRQCQRGGRASCDLDCPRTGDLRPHCGGGSQQGHRHRPWAQCPHG
jgi:CheY-like chemotaxis protein